MHIGFVVFIIHISTTRSTGIPGIMIHIITHRGIILTVRLHGTGVGAGTVGILPIIILGGGGILIITVTGTTIIMHGDILRIMLAEVGTIIMTITITDQEDPQVQVSCMVTMT